MRKCKRFSALLLAVCLVLSMAVPAVWATGTVTYTYDFNYTTSFGANYLTDVKDAIAAEYDAAGSQQNWKLKEGHNLFEGFNNGIYYWTHANGYVSKSGIALKYLRVFANVDGYVALTVKTPTTGVYQVDLTHASCITGAPDSMVYILDKDTTDIAAAIANATENEIIGNVSYAHTVATNDPATKADTWLPNRETDAKPIMKKTALDTWTADGDAEHILVFKATESTTHSTYGTTAHMYLTQLTLTGEAGAGGAGNEGGAGSDTPQYKEIVFNFDLLNQGLKGVSRNGLYDETCHNQIKNCFDKGTLNWKYRDMGFTSQKTSDVVFDSVGGSFRGRAQIGDWIAFTIKSPGKGEVELTLKHHATAYGASKMNVYLLPLDTISVEYALKDEYLLGTVNLYDPEQTLESPAPANLKETSLGKVTLGDEGGYVLAFKAVEKDENCKYSHLYFSQLIAKGTTTNVEYVEPELPVIPDDVLEQAIGEVAAKNAIGSYTVRVMATDVVNGHDYVYLAMMGGMFFVYDLDAGELVDYEENFQSTPRCIYIDKDGIVWVGGANGWLNRYDPISKTGEKIVINNLTDLFPNITSFNCWGLTGDGEGNLYFATYNTSYLAKFDSKTGEFTRISAHLSADAQYAGTGGVILKNGYAYLTSDGDKNSDGLKTHELIKFDLQKQEIVDRLDLYENLGSQNYLTYMYLVGGDVILGSTSAVLDKNVAVDISGAKMKLIEVPGLTGIKDGVSEEIDGKCYFLDFKYQLQAYDVATRTVSSADLGAAVPVKAVAGGIVTIEGDDRLPGKSIVTFQSAANELNLILYNIQTKETVTINNITDYVGTGNQLRTVTLSPDGKTIYVGAYGINQISVYDVESGKVIKQFATEGHQAEGLIWYEGLLYGGHYGTNGTGISAIDVVKGESELLVTLDNSVFIQHRMHANAAGDGKVFYGTAPIMNVLGGVLCWYDIEEDRVYVVAGPNKEDVYYTEAGNVSGTGWYSAVTGQLADFDDDNDGKDDAYIGEAQRFTGLIKEQSINCIIYKDGYIYGSTTRAGGSGAINDKVGNACLFVYDVENMELVGTCDMAEAISGLAGPVEFVDAIAMDPDVEGKFWGVVSDTLFSYTVDLETGKFTVKEELSYGKAAYNNGKNDWQSRDIIFDGDFMYLVFGSRGVYMVNRQDPSVNYRISKEIPKRMVLAADYKLYYTCNINDLMVLDITENTQEVLDSYRIPKVQEMIDALDDAADITLEDEAAVLAARAEYNRLTDAGKAQINADKLIAAEAVIAPLRAAADKAAAEAVINQIAAIGTVTLKSEDTIKAARFAYDVLTTAQKSLVTNLDVLEKAEASLAALKENPKTGDMTQVVALGGILVLSAGLLTALLISDDRKKRA